MQVREVMIPIAGHVDPDDSLRDAAEKMKALNLNPMPVVDAGKVVGVLTEQGMIERAERDGLAVGSQLVRDAMSTDVVCCSADEPIESALERIDKSRTARAPVVDSAGHLVGIVSAIDLRKREEIVPGEVTAVSDVESISELVHFDEDSVDFMSDASFPASDPIPPPSSLGRRSDEKNRNQ